MRQEENRPKWLEETQQKSWEPEILISGIVLFGLLQMPALYDELLLYYQKEVSQFFSDFENLISLMKLANFWLVLGLIIHLISRGFWVGLVGLSYLMPDGINFSRLKFSKQFAEEVSRIPEIDLLIIRAEKICSSLFSITFLLFLSIIGAYTYVLVTIIGPFYLLDSIAADQINSLAYKIYNLTVLGIAVILLFDFVSLGLLKRIGFLTKIYFPITRFARIITLAPLYRPIYYNLASNVNRWLFMVVIVLFIASSFFLSDRFFQPARDIDSNEDSAISMFYQRTGSSIYSGYYEDVMGEIYSFRTQIPSEIIDEEILRVFVVMHPNYDEEIREACDGYGIERGDMRTDQYYLECLNRSYFLYLNDSLIEDPGLKYYYNQKTEQKGLRSWLDIRDLPRGKHILEVKLVLIDDTIQYSTVPFFKTVDKYEK